MPSTTVRAATSPAARPHSATGATAVSDLGPYRDPEGRDQTLRALVGAAGGELVPYGTSVEGRPLLAARLPRIEAAADGAGGRPPRLLVTAGIHGPEYVGCALALELLARARGWPPLDQLRARAELWVIPCLNPDGYAGVWQRRGQGRMAELRPNARGVDRSRNFPLPTGTVRRALPGAGSTRAGAATYVGPAPLSEPESAALAELAERCRFAAASNSHCFMGRLIPAHVEDAPSFAGYRELCRVFAAAQPHRRYGRLHSRRLDTFTGELEDFLHHRYGSWAVCVETFPWTASLRQHLRAPSLFWRMNPRDPRVWIDNDLPGVVALLSAALDRGPPVIAPGQE
jgi:Zinc carboxypeptidase